MMEISVKKIMDSKFPGLSAKIPRFFMRYVQRITHEKEINLFFRDNEEKRGYELLKAYLDYCRVTYKAEGLEQSKGFSKITFVSNHPMGVLDSASLIVTLAEGGFEAKVPANDLVVSMGDIGSFTVPVNKTGSNSKNLAALNDMFKLEDPLVFFPAGLSSRKVKGELLDVKWTKTAFARSVKNDRVIVPVFISGANTSFFYNLSRFRKSIGLKMNVEQYFLIHEAHKLKGSHFDLIFGKPIRPDVFDKRYDILTWAAKVKAHVYRMRDGYRGEFDPEFPVMDKEPHV